METKATILLVDDEERILRSLKMIFIRHYNVITTTNPYDAIEIGKQNKVDVIISDQRMPQMMGAELLREFKIISPNSIRLLLTGYSDLNAIISSINEGEIFRFISKPWGQEEILETVHTAVQLARECPYIEEIRSHETEVLPNMVVIDSDPETHRMVQETIGDKVNIISHNSLDAGLEALSTIPTSMLVTDLHIDNEDISQTINALRQQNPQLITIVLTSLQDSQHLIEMINHGQVFRFLPKPARRGLLSQCFDSALKQHQRFMQNPQLIRRQQAAQSSQEKRGLSEKLKGYLQKIQRRQQLSV